MERSPANEMQTLAALSPRDRDLWEMYMTWQQLRRNPSLSSSIVYLSLSFYPSLDPIAAVPVLAHLLHLPKKALDQG